VVFASGFGANILYVFLIPPVHHIIFDLISLIIFQMVHKSYTSSVRDFLHPPNIWFLVRPKKLILLNTVLRCLRPTFSH